MSRLQAETSTSPPTTSPNPLPPLNVLCVLPSITRGLRPTSPANGSSLFKSTTRKEMTAALVNPAASLNPVRRSSINTLTPNTYSSGSDEEKRIKALETIIPEQLVESSSEDEKPTTLFAPPIRRSLTGDSHTTVSPRSTNSSLPPTSHPTAPTPAASSSQPPSSQPRPPPFGSSSSARTVSTSVEPPKVRPSRRRPQTSGASGFGETKTTTFGGKSVSGESGKTGSSVGGNGRPGWEGDEVVKVLRHDGMQVTTLRSASQITAHIRHLHSSYGSYGTDSPTYSPRISSTFDAMHILLVPLSDSPTLPSLSLLLAQGTTPSAVCFQQDLLDRARRTEADWLPSALHMISTATAPPSASTSKEDQYIDGSPPKVWVIAYSANPALNRSVVESCLNAGAVGVLQPPYESGDTARRVRSLVRRALRGDGRAAGKTTEDRGRPGSPGTSTTSAGALNSGVPVTPLSGTTVGGAVSPKGSTTEPLPAINGTEISPTAKTGTTPTSIGSPSMRKSLFADLDLATRRKSVDTGGLALALERATQAYSGGGKENHSFFNGYQMSPTSPAILRTGSGLRGTHTASSSPDRIRSDLSESGLGVPRMMKQDRSSSLIPHGTVDYSRTANERMEGLQESEGNDTVLAELLTEMYRQTRTAIEIQMVDYPALSAPLTQDQRANLINQLASWHFKPHKLEDGDLFRCACIMFEAVLQIEGLKELGIEQDQMNRFLFAVRAIYHAPNPYHNYIHAIDVLQASYTFLVAIGVAPPFDFVLNHPDETWKRPKFSRQEDASETTGMEDNARLKAFSLLRPQDVFGVMIAAMGHDVGHPGLSNAFMKNAKTPLSQVYDDKSVLENMHCMLIVQLLRKHGFGFLLDTTSISIPPVADWSSSQNTPLEEASTPSPFSSTFPNLPPVTKRQPQPGAITDWKGFRKVLYSAVLATDMSLHFNWIHRFRDLGKRARDGPDSDEESSAGTPSEDDDRIVLCQAIIKCADISNPTRPIDVSEHWSSVLLQEWAKQAHLEQELDLPVSVIASADAALQAKGQIGFIDLFTLPLFEAAAEAMPALQYFAGKCSENRALWQARLDTLQAIPGTQSASQALETAFTSSAQDSRFRSLFPLSLPASLLSRDREREDAPSVASSVTGDDLQPPVRPRSQASHSSYNSRSDAGGMDPDAHVMRVAYRAHIKKQPSSHHVPTLRVPFRNGDREEGGKK